MRRGWSRFGLYVIVVVVLVVVVLATTTGTERSVGEVVAQLVFIGGTSYLLTFIVWPRRTRLSRRHHTQVDSSKLIEARRTKQAPKPDQPSTPGPAVSQARAAAGAEVHAREASVEKRSRGRRPSERQSTGEMRWPAR